MIDNKTEIQTNRQTEEVLKLVKKNKKKLCVTDSCSLTHTDTPRQTQTQTDKQLYYHKLYLFIDTDKHRHTDSVWSIQEHISQARHPLRQTDRQTLGQTDRHKLVRHECEQGDTNCISLIPEP